MVSPLHKNTANAPCDRVSQTNIFSHTHIHIHTHAHAKIFWQVMSLTDYGGRPGKQDIIFNKASGDMNFGN